MSLVDYMIALTGVSFHLIIAGIYVASKHQRMDLVKKLGYFIVAMALPVSITLVYYALTEQPSKLLLYLTAILVYLVLEFLLDFVLKVDFRKKPVIHVPYIVMFYLACFGFIGVAFSFSSFWGYAMSGSFWLLLASLIYLLVGKKKPPSTG
jgi:hypothetical protein